ncbi:glyoxalase-like domain-containing protein [Pholiota molesta]|nr:glyoxalase-like domain-containing protein [Pholiota molesta]
MSSVNTRTLDHIVHLTPPGSVEEVSTQFRKLGFNVLPGGVHADGLTENALVVFEDGVYLELISFTHPESHYPPGSPPREKRNKNPWASKPPGWIDFAFLGNGSLANRISDAINERARAHGSSDLYGPEEEGGRTRPDGIVLKWLISPPPLDKRGILPFFCGDVTSRTLRVPSELPSNTKHPSTAQGISFIRALVSPALFDQVGKDLEFVIGTPPLISTSVSLTWELDTVRPLGGRSPRLLVDIPVTDAEEIFLRNSKSNIAVYEVGFRVTQPTKGDTTTPYGRISWDLN